MVFCVVATGGGFEPPDTLIERLDSLFRLQSPFLNLTTANSLGAVWVSLFRLSGAYYCALLLEFEDMCDAGVTLLLRGK